MKEYDAVVVGAGDVGLGIVFSALADDMRVALIERRDVGGTCVNVGCVPSKTLIFAADRVMEIREAGKLGIAADIKNIDFNSVMKRMREAVDFGRNSIREALESSANLDFYHGEGRFVDHYTLEVKDERIKGRKIFIASGTRPFIPPVKGLDGVNYLTNETLLKLEKKPDSMIIIGGGYIGVEYAHFFEAMGTAITLAEKGPHLVLHEEPEISELLKKELKRRMKVLTGAEVVEVKRGRSGYIVVVRSDEGGTEELMGDEVLIAVGRKSNADLLDIEKTGLQAGRANFIDVNDYLETGRENIWAVGDAIGRQMFTHAGDKEAEVAWHNATHEEKLRMDFVNVPHAVFTYPQIASVGLTEEKAREGHAVLVGRAKYSDTVKGTAMVEHEGFAKAVVEKETGRILGFHIIGPYAPILIQEVVNAMIHDNDVSYISESMHIFPALSGLITETLENLE
ncbi:MAG: dihydrolipoyl dehydrogenase [Candidatus Sulfobium sp.]|jgi:mycothione reductase